MPDGIKGLLNIKGIGNGRDIAVRLEHMFILRIRRAWDVLWVGLLANRKGDMVSFLEKWARIISCRTYSKILDVVLRGETGR